MNIPNFDPQEIDKFNQLAQQWWDAQGPCAPLHQLNPLRMAFIQQHSNLQGKHIVDVGCGGGILTEALAKAGAQVLGLDQAQEVLHAARVHLQAQTVPLAVEYRCESVENLAQQLPAHFDHVTCMEMLEHVPESETVIQACSTLVKPGGKIFFSTLNRNVKSYLQAIIGAEYILKLLPRGTHDYARFIKPSELVRWARAAGLELGAMQGLSYHPLTKQYTLTPDVSVNYLAVFSK